MSQSELSKPQHQRNPFIKVVTYGGEYKGYMKRISTKMVVVELAPGGDGAEQEISFVNVKRIVFL